MWRLLPTALGVLITVAIVGCKGSGPHSTPANPAVVTPIDTATMVPSATEPQGDLRGGTCDEAFGVAMVNRLFVALNEGDARTVQSLFPAAPGSWSIELVPDLLAAAETSIDSTRTGISRASTPSEILSFVLRLAGIHFTFRSVLSGGSYIDTNPGTVGRPMVGIGPVLWRATGKALEDRGRSAVDGGGKVGLNCETGRFEKVLLSPLSFTNR